MGKLVGHGLMKIVLKVLAIVKKRPRQFGGVFCIAGLASTSDILGHQLFAGGKNRSGFTLQVHLALPCGFPPSTVRSIPQGSQGCKLRMANCVSETTGASLRLPASLYRYRHATRLDPTWAWWETPGHGILARFSGLFYTAHPLEMINFR